MVEPNVYGLWSKEEKENRNVYKKDLDDSSLKFVIESLLEENKIYVFIGGDYITGTSEYIKENIDYPEKVAVKITKKESTTKKTIKEVLEELGFKKLHN